MSKTCFSQQLQQNEVKEQLRFHFLPLAGNALKERNYFNQFQMIFPQKNLPKRVI